MSQSFFARMLLKLDDWRVRQHFKRVERLTRARDVSHLPNALQAARTRQLDELHRYVMRGIFPRNHQQAGYAPCFIDRDGRECAVAHLVLADGGLATAYRIADLTNNAYVPEMNFLALDVWAASSGLSREEMALIQPTYIPPELRDSFEQLSLLSLSVIVVVFLTLFTSVVGVLTFVVNIVKLHRRKTGRWATFLGLIAGVVLLLCGVVLAIQMQIGTALVETFRAAQQPMSEPEIVFARYTFAQGWIWVGAVLLVAAACIAVSCWRLKTLRLNERNMLKQVLKPRRGV